MKNLIYPVLFLVAIFISSCSKNMGDASSEKNANQQISKDNLTEVEFQCNTMHCTDCENAIAKTVKKLDETAEVNSSYQTKLVKIKFDKTKTTKENIVKSLTDAGYPPEPVN